MFKKLKDKQYARRGHDLYVCVCVDIFLACLTLKQRTTQFFFSGLMYLFFFVEYIFMWMRRKEGRKDEDEFNLKK